VWAIVAGGGTGGHIVPAIAIGRALVERGHPASSIHYVGSRRGLDGQMVPNAGFNITLLPGRGIVRRLSWANVGAVAGLVAAVFQATVLVARTRPSVVVAVGGYASVACALAAAVLRVPLVVAEQNAAPGLANRLAARFARACAVSFQGTPLPRAVMTGNPVRPEILAIDRSPEGRAGARAALGLPADRRVVAVAGGSLGAARINEAVLGLAATWAGCGQVAIRHVAGQRDFEAVSSRAPRPRSSQAEPARGSGDDEHLVYQVVAFEDRMDLLLAAADVGVHRSGASTVSELAVAGLPAVLVPLPGAPADHQTQNALRLAEAGAAVLVPDGELDASRLESELDRLLRDDAALKAMGEAARGMARPEAAAAVAALVEAHARG